jgi:NTP pyrophosphatase (non-canonical NTP hydrolase)
MAFPEYNTLGEHLDHYQKVVTKIKNYPVDSSDLYLLGKLTEESGEIAKEIVRQIDGKKQEKDLTSELGDLLWVITAIAEDNGIPMSQVVEVNIEKLRKRNLL